MSSHARDRLPARSPCRSLKPRWLLVVLVLGTAQAWSASSELSDAVARIKPSVVGIGTFLKTRSPPVVFSGTGFAVADGLHIVTNAHVLPKELDAERKEALIVLVGGADDAEGRTAKVVATDKARDLALLQITGTPLPALTIGNSDAIREGQALAFTGFPIGMALGLYPATHRATVAALVPIVRPGITSRQLNPRMIKRLRDSAYVVFQLDATAYPGNSGSPLFDPATAEVQGVINSVFIQGTREQAISRPSGITYAIPSTHIQDLLDEAKPAPSR